MKTKKILTIIISVALLIAMGTTALAATYHPFTIRMENDNEDDNHGVLLATWAMKQFSATVGRVECDTYVASDAGTTYNWKACIWHHNDDVRATEYEWMHALLNETFSYLSGYGTSGGLYHLWGRRDDRLTCSWTEAEGDWRP